MKTVFSNSQLAHVWAQQQQSEGRNAGNSMFFRDNKIYSYGSHYLAAQIYNGNTVLINNYHYSVSTSKHLSDIWNATSHYGQFSVSTPDNPLQSVQDTFCQDVQETVDTNEMIESALRDLTGKLNKLLKKIGA